MKLKIMVASLIAFVAFCTTPAKAQITGLAGTVTFTTTTTHDTLTGADTAYVTWLATGAQAYAKSFSVHLLKVAQTPNDTAIIERSNNGVEWVQYGTASFGAADITGWQTYIFDVPNSIVSGNWRIKVRQAGSTTKVKLKGYAFLGRAN